MKYILTFLTLILSSTLVFAEDGDKGKGKDRDKKKQRGIDFDGDRKFDRMKMMSERFKKENPEKYKELEELKESNPEEFRRQMRELIQKKIGDHMKKGRTMGDRHWLYEMKEKNPEKYEELMKMRESDPEAFRQKMVQEFSQRYHHKGKHDDSCRKEIGEILKKYNASASEDEKASLKKQLRAKMEESFHNDLKKRIEMAEKLETHLKEVKTQIEDRESKKDSLIDEKVEYLIKGKFHKGAGRKPDPKKDAKRD